MADRFKNSPEYMSGFIIVAAAYILAGKSGLLLAYIQPNATAVWAPTGIAIAAILLFGYRFWPAIFIGAFVTNITTAGTIMTSLGIASGNTLEGLVAAFLITRLAEGTKAFNKARGVVLYAVLAGGLSTAISATLGVTSLALAGFAQWGNFPAVWATWWLGDAGGALIVAPFIVLWFTDRAFQWTMRRIAEGIVAALCLIALSVLMTIGHLELLLILMPPLLIWMAFRFNKTIVATWILILTEIAVWSILRNATGAGAAALNQSLVLLQAFMATTAITMMTLAAAVAERQSAIDQLMANNRMLAREEAKDNAILESIGDGLIVTDIEKKIILANSAAKIMLGWEDKDIIGKSAVELMPIEDVSGKLVPENARPAARALAERKTISTIGSPAYYCTREDGTKIPVALTATPVFSAGESIGMIDLVKDMTAEHNIDRAKDEFISIAAHQLRTPLSSMRWALELLLGEKMPASRRKRLTEVEQSNERLIAIVHDLLNVSRLESSGVAPSIHSFDIAALIGGIIDLQKNIAAERGITIDFASGETPFLVSSDEKLISEAVGNVIDNAISYAPKGSAIAVRTERKNDRCLIEVANDGEPISENDRPNIFKRFFRGAGARLERPAGSGLGLYIAKLGVERAGGNIWFDSPLSGNRGTAFYISLPVPRSSSDDKPAHML